MPGITDDPAHQSPLNRVRMMQEVTDCMRSLFPALWEENDGPIASIHDASNIENDEEAHQEAPAPRRAATRNHRIVTYNEVEGRAGNIERRTLAPDAHQLIGGRARRPTQELPVDFQGGNRRARGNRRASGHRRMHNGDRDTCNGNGHQNGDFRGANFPRRRGSGHRPTGDGNANGGSGHQQADHEDGRGFNSPRRGVNGHRPICNGNNVSENGHHEGANEDSRRPNLNRGRASGSRPRRRNTRPPPRIG